MLSTGILLPFGFEPADGLRQQHLLRWRLCHQSVRLQPWLHSVWQRRSLHGTFFPHRSQPLTLALQTGLHTRQLQVDRQQRRVLELPRGPLQRSVRDGLVNLRRRLHCELLLPARQQQLQTSCLVRSSRQADQLLSGGLNAQPGQRALLRWRDRRDFLHLQQCAVLAGCELIVSSCDTVGYLGLSGQPCYDSQVCVKNTNLCAPYSGTCQPSEKGSRYFLTARDNSFSLLFARVLLHSADIGGHHGRERHRQNEQPARVQLDVGRPTSFVRSLHRSALLCCCFLTR